MGDGPAYRREGGWVMVLGREGGWVMVLLTREGRWVGDGPAYRREKLQVNIVLHVRNHIW